MPISILAQSQAAPLVIRALEAPLASRQLMANVPLGQVWLQGRSLPARPIIFRGRQRVKTTWLPGNPTATQQVMGPTEEPTVLNGRWADKFLGDGVALSLANLFRDLKRAGGLLELSWSGIARRGILTEVEFTIDRPQDVAFRLEFTWRGDDQPVAPATISVGIENPRQGFAQVSQSLQDLLDELAGYDESPLASLVRLPSNLRADLEATALEAETLIGAFQTGVNVGTAVFQTPTVAAQRALQVSGKAADVAASTRDLFLSVSALDQVPQDSALELLTFLDQRFTVLHSADVAQEQAVTTKNAMEGQILPEVIAEVRPPPGTDLRDLAMTYYGDPDLWTIISQYNGLEGSAVPAPPTGVSDNASPPILIPRRLDGALTEMGC